MTDGFQFDGSWSDDGTNRSQPGCSGCLAVGGIFVGIIVFIFAFFWLITHKRQVELIVVVGLVGAAAYFGRGYLFALFDRRGARAELGTMPTPLADVKAGALTRAAGLVGVNAPTQHAPLGAPPCVFFRVVVEGVDPSGVIFEGRSADELLLEDGMGAKLLVRLDGAKWLGKRSHDLVSSPEVPDPLLVTYLSERGIQVARAVRARVEWIAPHELVFVRGIPHEPGTASSPSMYRTSEARTPPLELVSTRDEPVLISLDPIG